MARAIQPFATVGDGDVLYAATTGEVDNPRLSPAALTLVASELAWDAVLSSVPAADPPAAWTRVSVDARALDAYAGEYELGPGARLSVRRDGERLVAESARGGQYVPAERAVGLVPVGRNEFLLETARRDRLRFDADAAGRITGLTINPGQWSLAARRVVSGR